ncbi:hypothetical protein [Pseudooceanicola sp.]|uniref:hypothetical protein n=1 Tax=Pseudooceanicola sp. TaxID=1914328 RepID=UPI002621AFEA|nr:hypothetical protein [Pseudooceanicola sp.]MDF1855121.1 hypothetical protein [Pseudooceanicola sp.]
MSPRRAALCTAFWLALVPIPGLAQPLSTAAVIAAADAALAQAAAGDRTGARDALIRLGDGLPDDSPALARAYPYLALARLYRSVRNWELSERMAAGAAQILDAGGYGTHPHRVEALRKINALTAAISAMPPPWRGRWQNAATCPPGRIFWRGARHR